ncbi:MAG: hypothetical protein R3284_04050 [Rubricoccaceae bacterium]|nr:hypothetical protein [Rubricoccaceae bacterium]
MIDLEWPDGDGTSGVHTHEGNLLWWYRPGGPGGRFGEAARTQTLDDFRENGPAVSAPPRIVKQLVALLGEKGD